MWSRSICLARPRAPPPRPSASSMKSQRMALETVSPGRDVERAHDAARPRRRSRAASSWPPSPSPPGRRAPRRPRPRRCDDGALHRRAQRRRCPRVRRIVVGRGSSACGGAGLAVRQHGQRIDRHRAACRPARGVRPAPAVEVPAGLRRLGARAARLMCSSTKRVCTVPAQQAGMRAAGPAGRRYCVAAPSMPELRQRAIGSRGASPKSADGRARSPWPAASRSAGWCGSPHSRSRRPARPAPTAAHRRQHAAGRRAPCRPAASSPG